MENTADAGGGGGADHGHRVVLSLPRVDDHSAVQFSCELELRTKRLSLLVARRMIVVVIESTFANRHGATAHTLAEGRQVSRCVEARGIMGMHSGGEETPAGMRRGDCCRARCCVERLADAHDGGCPPENGALHAGLPVPV